MHSKVQKISSKPEIRQIIFDIVSPCSTYFLYCRGKLYWKKAVSVQKDEELKNPIAGYKIIENGQKNTDCEERNFL